MKRRITLTIDPAVARKAKRLAHARGTNVSSLIEGLVRAAPGGASGSEPFARRWAGKFRVVLSGRPDPRLAALKRRYALDKE
jgi:Family of unknown function (DUF6364)